MELAADLYAMMESRVKDKPALDVVLAAAGNVRNLKAAHPNYLVDAKAIIGHLKDICAAILDR